MRVWFSSAAVTLLAAAASSALAVAPCPESCHFGQGQPLYLTDLDNLLVKRCDQPTGASEGVYECRAERLDIDGKLLEALPIVPMGNGAHGAFERSYLNGHTLVELNWQDAWPKLDQPYVLNTPFRNQELTLSLDGKTLSCAAPGQQPVKRDFGCVPREVHVFASRSHKQLPRRPVVIIGVCQTGAQTRHEVAVVCSAGERAK